MASLLCNAYGYKVKMINGGYAGMIAAKLPIVINGMLVEIIKGQTRTTENYEQTPTSQVSTKKAVSSKALEDASSLSKQFSNALTEILAQADTIEAVASAKGDEKAALAIKTLKRLARELRASSATAPLDQRLFRTTQILTGMADSLGNGGGQAEGDLASPLRHTGSVMLQVLTPLLTKGRSAKSISNLQVKVALETDPNFTIVDVRERDEFILHYAGAVNIPLETFFIQAKQEKLPFDKNRPIAFLCASGSRAGQAAAAALMAGFKDVYAILGGVNAGFGCGVPLVYNGSPLPNPRADAYPSEVRALPLVYGGGMRYW